MPYWDHDLTTMSATRVLARSLLAEALRCPQAASARPTIVLPRRTHTGKGAPWRNPEILATLRAFIAATGRLPTHRDWQNAAGLGLPSRQTVMRHYGSMEVLVLALRDAAQKGGDTDVSPRGCSFTERAS